MRDRMKRFLLVTSVGFFLVRVANAAAPLAGSVGVSLDVVAEEGTKVLMATVTKEGKPVEGLKVAFLVERTFGRMSLGEEETLDDGTAAAPFPVGLPAGVAGSLRLIARVQEPGQSVPAEALVETSPAGDVVAGGAVAPEGPQGERASPGASGADPFPRELWAPRSPLGLIVPISTLLVIVWSLYSYVMLQLYRIWKEGSTRTQKGENTCCTT